MNDNDWVWVLRKDNVISMYGALPHAPDDKCPWYVKGLAIRSRTAAGAHYMLPAWNEDLPERVTRVFAAYTFVRASRAEAEALIAMARAEAAMEGT